MNNRLDQLDLFCLKPSEKKIIVAISKMGKPIADISRNTGIPRTSLLYMLRKLQETSIVKPVMIGKRKYWRSNIPQVLLRIQNKNSTLLFP